MDGNWSKPSSEKRPRSSSQPHHRGKHCTTCRERRDIFTLVTPPPVSQEALRPELRVASLAWGTHLFAAYLDHQLFQRLGLSNPAAGLFRRVPSRPSSLHLSRLHGSARGTSCTAAGQCAHPQCCRVFPPECSGLGAAKGKGWNGKAINISILFPISNFAIRVGTLRMEKQSEIRGQPPQW